MKVVRVFLSIGLVFLVLACTAAQPAPEDDLSTYLEPATLRDLMENPPEGFLLVDVRTPGEYESGHIPGASNTELAIIGDQPPTDDLNAIIVVYCRSGSRSAQAAAILSDLGYTRVLDWGGVGRWPYELVTGPAER